MAGTRGNSAAPIVQAIAGANGLVTQAWALWFQKFGSPYKIESQLSDKQAGVTYQNQTSNFIDVYLSGNAITGSMGDTSGTLQMVIPASSTGYMRVPSGWYYQVGGAVIGWLEGSQN